MHNELHFYKHMPIVQVGEGIKWMTTDPREHAEFCSLVSANDSKKLTSLFLHKRARNLTTIN